MSKVEAKKSKKTSQQKKDLKIIIYDIIYIIGKNRLSTDEIQDLKIHPVIFCISS